MAAGFVPAAETRPKLVVIPKFREADEAFRVSEFVPLNVSALPVVSALVLEAYTTPPEVKEVSPVPPFVVASVPVTPVERGKPVALVKVPDDGVPRAPPLATNAPAVPTLTARAVATLVPSPEIPVDTGSPVALVRVTEVGVPRIGVTSVGEVFNTTEPVPVLVVTPVPPLATGSVPVTLDDREMLVSVLLAPLIVLLVSV